MIDFSAGLVDSTLHDPCANNGDFLFPGPVEDSYSLGGRWTLPLQRGAALTFGLSYAYTGAQQTHSGGTAIRVQRRTARLISRDRSIRFALRAARLHPPNGRVRYASASGSWELTVFGNNLTDEVYGNFATRFGGAFWDTPTGVGADRVTATLRARHHARPAARVRRDVPIQLRRRRNCWALTPGSPSPTSKWLLDSHKVIALAFDDARRLRLFGRTPCASIEPCLNSRERPIPRSFELASRESSRAGVLGRGHVYPKLLTYLADCTIRGDVPKEFDITVDVFGKAKGDVDAPDAQTRVHIYKLRARLDTYYAGAGKNDAVRLEIPKGTYHLCAVANETRCDAYRYTLAGRWLGMRSRACSSRSCYPSRPISHWSRAVRRRQKASLSRATSGRA